MSPGTERTDLTVNTPANILNPAIFLILPWYQNLGNFEGCPSGYFEVFHDKTWSNFQEGPMRPFFLVKYGADNDQCSKAIFKRGHNFFFEIYWVVLSVSYLSAFIRTTWTTWPTWRCSASWTPPGFRTMRRKIQYRRYNVFMWCASKNVQYLLSVRRKTFNIFSVLTST